MLYLADLNWWELEDSSWTHFASHASKPVCWQPQCDSEREDIFLRIMNSCKWPDVDSTPCLIDTWHSYQTLSGEKTSDLSRCCSPFFHSLLFCAASSIASRSVTAEKSLGSVLICASSRWTTLFQTADGGVDSGMFECSPHEQHQTQKKQPARDKVTLETDSLWCLVLYVFFGRRKYSDVRGPTCRQDQARNRFTTSSVAYVEQAYEPTYTLCVLHCHWLCMIYFLLWYNMCKPTMEFPNLLRSLSYTA